MDFSKLSQFLKIIPSYAVRSERSACILMSMEKIVVLKYKDTNFKGK